MAGQIPPSMGRVSPRLIPSGPRAGFSAAAGLALSQHNPLLAPIGCDARPNKPMVTEPPKEPESRMNPGEFEMMAGQISPSIGPGQPEAMASGSRAGFSVTAGFALPPYSPRLAPIACDARPNKPMMTEPPKEPESRMNPGKSETIAGHISPFRANLPDVAPARTPADPRWAGTDSYGPMDLPKKAFKRQKLMLG
jgi:hypothetical protein